MRMLVGVTKRVLCVARSRAQSAGPGRTLVVTAPNHRIPAELEGIAVAWTHEPPTLEELAMLLRDAGCDLILLEMMYRPERLGRDIEVGPVCAAEIPLRMGDDWASA